MSKINSYDLTWDHYAQFRRLSSVSSGSTNTLADSAVAFEEGLELAEAFVPEVVVPFVIGMQLMSGAISFAQIMMRFNKSKRQKTVTGSNPIPPVTGSAPDLPHKPVYGSNPYPPVTGSAPIEHSGAVNSFLNNMERVLCLKDVINSSGKPHKTFGKPWILTEIRDKIIDGGEGFVTTEQIAAFGTLRQLQPLGGSYSDAVPAVPGSIYIPAVSWADLNPAAGDPAGSRYPANVDPKDVALVVKKIDIKFQFINLSNNATFCVLRCWKVKTDLLPVTSTVIDFAGQAWASSIMLPDVAQIFPSANVLPSLLSDAVGVPNYYNNTTPHENFLPPGTFSKTFRDKFSLVKKYPFQLASGQKITLDVNHYCDFMSEDQPARVGASTTNYYINGAYIWTLSQHGSVVAVAGSDGSPGWAGYSELSYGENKIGVLTDTKVHCYNHVSRKTGETRKTTGYYIVAQNPIAKEETINPDTNMPGAGDEVA